MLKIRRWVVNSLNVKTFSLSSIDIHSKKLLWSPSLLNTALVNVLPFFSFLFFFANLASLPTSGFVSSFYSACAYWVHSMYGDPNVRVKQKVYVGLNESSSSFKPAWTFIHSAGCVFGIHRCRLLKCHDIHFLHTAYDIRWKSTAYWIFVFMGQHVVASRHAMWVLWFYAPLKVSWTNLIHTHISC